MTTIPFLLVAVMAALSWRHARSQSPVRVGRPETPARTVQIPPVAATRDAAAGATTSSVAPVRVPEPTHTRLGDTATLDPVPAPPGRAAGAHDLDLRGPQHTNGWVMSC